MSRFQEIKDKLRVMYGVTISKRNSAGEYRVNFKGGKEATAYYTDDLEDAFATGVSMANRQRQTHREHLTVNPRRTRVASRAVTVAKLRKRSAKRPARAAKKVRRIKSATFRKHAMRRIERLDRNPVRPLPVKHLWTIEASFPRKSAVWWHFTNDCTFADTGGNRMLFHSAADAARRMNLIKKVHGALLRNEGCERLRVSRYQ